MNNYTKAINKFLSKVMTPEMLYIHTQLVSLEEFGYESAAILDYRKRLDTLAPVYSFLNEVVDGEEEYNWQDLKMFIDMAGLGYNRTAKQEEDLSGRTSTIWLGATEELFTIDKTIINEITNLDIGPNDGSKQSETKLDSIWINNQTDLSHTTDGKLEDDTRISVEPGTAHVLIITPVDVGIEGIYMEILEEWYSVDDYGETVIQDVYDPNTGLIEDKNCYFLRDVSHGIYSTNTRFKVTTRQL